MTKKTHDTKATLSNNLEPEQIYQTGYYSQSNRRGSSEEPPAPVRPDNNEDISRDALETTADYTSRLTTGEIGDQQQRRLRKGNVFAVDSDLNYLHSRQGLTSGESNDNANTEIIRDGRTLGTFLDASRQANSEQANRFDTTSLSSYGRPESTDNPFFKERPVIDKTKSKDGHVLLTNIKEEKKNSRTGAPAVYTDGDNRSLPETQKRISSVLENNRFNPSDKTPFMRDNSRIVDDQGRKRFGTTKQGEMGVYNKNSDFVLEEELKKVGTQLVNVASGQADLNDGKTTRDGNVNIAEIFSAQRLTGWQSIDASDMRAFSTPAGGEIVAPTSGEKSSLLQEEGSEGNPDAKKSYGVLNNSYEQFSSPAPVSMIVNTLVGMLTLFATAVLIRTLMSAFARSENEGIIPGAEHPKNMVPGRHSLYKNLLSSKMRKLFNVPDLEHDFDSCVVAGILSFYGLEGFAQFLPDSLIKKPSIKDIAEAAKNPGAITGLNVLDKFSSLANSAGYYSIITRAASRDSRQILDAFKASSGSSIIGAVSTPLRIFDAILESTTYKFLMTIAVVGDKLFSSMQGHPTIGGNVGPRADSPLARVSSNRNLSGELTWRNSSVNSMYLLPEVFTQANLKVRKNSEIIADKIFKSAGAVDQALEFDINETKGSNTKNTGRFSKDVVEAIENRLDAEYVPFYFHDIRTNEIIAFHAFLTTLDDSYSADYASTPAYGRGDEIKTYSKTTRAISLKFYIAATNPDDMNEMYWKLNKLVSLVYPQWSRGRSVVNGEGINAEKFIQPFSQIPTASPLVRIRLGDVLTSNYSRFGLMRLFGLGDNKNVFTLDLDESKSSIVEDPRKEQYEKDLKEAERKQYLALALREVNPGADDASQRTTFTNAYALYGAEDAQGAVNSVDFGDNSIFGYQPGDKILIHPTHGDGAKGYWPRNAEGKLAKQISGYKTTNSVTTQTIEFATGRSGTRGRNIYKTETKAVATPANKLIAYSTSDVRVEVIKRIPDGVSPLVQNEKNFSKHVDKVDGNPAIAWFDEATADFMSQHNGDPNHFGTMAYLVKVHPGSDADIQCDKRKIPTDMRYHRVLHDQICGMWDTTNLVGWPEPIEPDQTIWSNREHSYDKLQQFFDPKNNFIVRSFESTAGRGLAGFITTLGIDWKLNEATWDIDFGMIAPKYVEVNIGFSPIHDIPLGLDHSGMMRSLPYKVGGTSRLVGGDPHNSSAEERRASFEALEDIVSDQEKKFVENVEKAKKDVDKIEKTVNTAKNSAVDIKKFGGIL